MSRFFRSGDSSTSSEDEDEDEIEVSADSELQKTSVDANRPSSQLAALSVAGNNQDGAVNQDSQQWTSHHKDVLLHALLEHWCLTDTLEAHGGAEGDDPSVKAEAHARYLRLTSQLASLNVLPSGLGNDQHAAMRQRYRDGLGALSRQHSDTAMPSGVRRMLTDGSADAAQPLQSLLLQSSPQHLAQEHFALQAPLRRLLGFEEHVNSYDPLGPTMPSPQPPGLTQNGANLMFGQSRYHSDFKELSILGHGGYGIVYHTLHRIDNQAYAVKKVPLSPARLHRIRTRGQSEVDEILLELRTLAKLHHPNIVRYYNGWVEWADTPTLSGIDSVTSRQPPTDSLDAVAGASDTRLRPFQRVFTESGDSSNGIVFEESDSGEAVQSEGSDGALSGQSREQNELRRIRTRSGTATVSDETVESVNREAEVSASILSTADGGASFGQPTLAIHMQMSLYPTTLSDLLGNRSGAADALRHCYHLQPSAGIVTAVLEGLEYLHEEGIVHRDIKPANIFLSPKRARGPRRNCVDLKDCGDCEHDNNVARTELEVCIGDFGLAAVADPDTSEDSLASHASPVGTAIYRPLSTEARSKNLDIYALGIVLFELLWKTKTRMERHHTISELKEGKYPNGFCEWISEGKGGLAMNCIDCMLARHAREVTIEEVKEKLRALVAPMH